MKQFTYLDLIEPGTDSTPKDIEYYYYPVF